MTPVLRSGYSTGACAAAAAKAAALKLLDEDAGAVACGADSLHPSGSGHTAADACAASMTVGVTLAKDSSDALGQAPAPSAASMTVGVTLPCGSVATLPIDSCEKLSAISARAAVIKDAGDDPDVTDGMSVVVLLEMGGEGITFQSGDGVGTVTSPGLQIPPGEPAINPVPRQMITAAIRETLGDVDCRVTVSIPGGRERAEKTFNPRLGIVGGLSVLGTTGRVMPKSEDAWLRSLAPQIDVAVAAGHTRLFLTPGGFGERAARDLLGAHPQTVIHTSNFIGEMLRACADRGVQSAVLVGHIGKLTKVAAGIFNTHSRFGDARLETVAAIAGASGASGALVSRLLDLPTCEAAIGSLAEAGMQQVWNTVADRAAQRATQHAGIPVSCALVGYERAIIGWSTDIRRHDPANAQGHLHIVGVGPGPAEWLSPVAWQIIKQAEVIVGGKRQLAEFAPPGVETIVIGADIAAVVSSIRQHAHRRVVVLAAGDPGCFGVLATLRREMADLEWRVSPGISAMQMALARLGEPWDGVAFASAHGRDLAPVVEMARHQDRTLVLTDHQRPPEILARALQDAGIESDLVVLERLGYPDERLTRGTTAQIASGRFDPLAVVWMERSQDG